MAQALSISRDEARAPVWVAQLFLLSLAMPFQIPVGPLLLMPHRIVLLVFFIPFFFKLFVMRRAGPILAADWFIMASAIWAAFALFANHPPMTMIEASGIHFLEVFGAYLLARVTLRSEADFRRMVRTFFVMVLFLLPFAAVESVTKRPLLLNLLPSSMSPVYMGERFGLRRAQTAFAHPILYGVFVSTSLGLFWYALKPRGIRFIAAPMSVLATIFSLSAGALASIVVQLIIIGWETVTRFLRARWRIFALGTVAFYFLIDMLSNRTPFHVIITYLTFSSNTGYTRIHIWNFGMDNVWANPIFGLGFNDWSRPSWLGDSIDNFWLVLMIRYGLPGFVMLVIALVLIIRRVSRADLTDPDDILARAGYLTVFGGIVIAGGTVHYWHAMMAFAFFIFGSGVWAGTGGGQRPDDQDQDETEPPTQVSRYTRQTKRGVPIGTGGRPRPAMQGRQRPARASRTSR
ncbi:MAG: O-antigen ligase family protein [Pseudomonadota bacterium]